MARAKFNQTDKTATAFLKRRTVRALMGILSLGLAYLAFVYAIDSGNLLAYLAIGVLVVIALREFFKAGRLRSRNNE